MYILTDTLGQPITTPDEPVLLGLNGEPIVHECRSGEGPPADLPDPEGKGLHPKIHRGTSELRSRNPSVGYAQYLLNRFLSKVNDKTISCDVKTTAVEKKLAAGVIELKAIKQWPLKVDCRFGSGTEIATKMFQACKGLKEDGVIGYKTWEKLVQYKPVSLPEEPRTPPGKLFRLEDHVANAKSSLAVHGVYWSSRRVEFRGKGAPFFNHHFITFIYRNLDQANKILNICKRRNLETSEASVYPAVVSKFNFYTASNQAGNQIFFSTIGFTTHTGGFSGYLCPVFLPLADREALLGLINPTKYKEFRGWTCQGKRVPPSYSTSVFKNSEKGFKDSEALMIGVIHLVDNFIRNYNTKQQGHPWKFVFTSNNCVSAVNTIFDLLGYTQKHREVLSDFRGIDFAKTGLVPYALFLPPSQS